MITYNGNHLHDILQIIGILTFHSVRFESRSCSEFFLYHMQEAPYRFSWLVYLCILPQPQVRVRGYILLHPSYRPS